MLVLLEALSAWFGPLRLFGYNSFRAAGAAATAFILMMIVMPPLVAWLRRKRFGEQGAKGDGALMIDTMRQAKSGTPTMGGLGLILCIVITVLLWCDPREWQVPLLLFAMIGFGTLGFVDDRVKIFKGAQGLGKRSKILLQIGLGLVCGLWFWWNDGNNGAFTIGQIHAREISEGVWAWRYSGLQAIDNALTLPFLSLDYAPRIGLGIVLWTLVMTFMCSNSVNFTDGLDGLASGVMLIAALAFMVIAYAASHFIAAYHLGIIYVPGAQEITIFCAALAGGCLGFMWFNGHPAEVFMGDTGSQALGGVLAMIAMCCKQEFLLLLVGSVFFIEGASVFLQVVYFRSTGGKRLFLCAPIHHHFQYKGWDESKIVIRFWIVAAVTALLALATLKLR